MSLKFILFSLNFLQNQIRDKSTEEVPGIARLVADNARMELLPTWEKLSHDENLAESIISGWEQNWNQQDLTGDKDLR